MRADDAFGAVAALAASQHGAFSRRQAARRDIDANQLFRWKATRRIHEPLPNVLTIVGAPVTWRQELKVLVLAGRGTGIISGAAAAALHGLDGFAEGPLEVTIPRPGTLRLTEAVVRRRAGLPFQDWAEVDGIRCTGLARTLVDLGEHHDAKVVQRALDDVRRRGKSLRWLRMTAERLHGPGRRGPGMLLGLLDEAEAEQRVPDSWFERLLELALTCPELPPIVRQHEIRTTDGSFVARLDLAIPSLLLGIEGHSREFHFGRRAERLDEDRDLAAAAQGWEILYLGWQAALRPTAALAKIRAVADARRRQLTVA